MPRNIVGSPVRGEDCFGRDAFIGRLEERLGAHSLLLLAPRRWGKTSVLLALRDRSPSDRHYLDLYRIERASDFVAELAALAAPITKARRAVEGALGHALGHIKEVRLGELAVELRERLATPERWQSTGSAVFSGLPSGSVLIFDEFPVMLKSILDRDRSEAEALLRWLRTERQGQGRPSQVLAGSTSLDELCRGAGLSDTVNDLARTPLPPFDANTASDLFRRLFQAEGLSVDDEAIGTALRLVGPEVPFFLQLLAGAVLAQARSTHARVTPSLVERVYGTRLLDADHRGYLDDFRGRLDRNYLPPERDVALAVLRSLARSTEGVDERSLRNDIIAAGGSEELLPRVLALLEGDFYVARANGGRYGFRNRYMADWWKRFHA